MWLSSAEPGLCSLPQRPGVRRHVGVVVRSRQARPGSGRSSDRLGRKRKRPAWSGLVLDRDAPWLSSSWQPSSEWCGCGGVPRRHAGSGSASIRMRTSPARARSRRWWCRRQFRRPVGSSWADGTTRPAARHRGPGAPPDGWQGSTEAGLERICCADRTHPGQDRHAVVRRDRLGWSRRGVVGERDLYDVTAGARSKVGDLAVFDPGVSTGAR